MKPELQQFLDDFSSKHHHEPEFMQAVHEFVKSIDFYNNKETADVISIVKRLVHPDRQIIFSVPWVDDQGEMQINQGYRVQFNNSLGPYKGGLRFHPSTNLSILKFLAFEQTLKNSLTGLPLGGAKGGSDFNPKGKSDGEIMRFCQSYMTSLAPYIGPNIDIPAGDMNVSQREIGYLFGQYKRLTHEFTGVITSKHPSYGGSLGRTEATGFGLCYFVENLLNDHNESLKDKKVIISGAGNVARGALQKATQLGATVIAMSDSTGTLIDDKGIDSDIISEIKSHRHDSLQVYCQSHPHATFIENSQELWNLPCDIALACAYQNEVDIDHVKKLHNQGCLLIGEGANMPLTQDASHYVIEHMMYAPGKAANAGGVVVSSFEMTQNASHDVWSFEKVDQKLQETMNTIYEKVSTCAHEYGQPDNLLLGANLASFERLAMAIKSQGIV